MKKQDYIKQLESREILDLQEFKLSRLQLKYLKTFKDCYPTYEIMSKHIRFYPGDKVAYYSPYKNPNKNNPYNVWFPSKLMANRCVGIRVSRTRVFEVIV